MAAKKKRHFPRSASAVFDDDCAGARWILQARAQLATVLQENAELAERLLQVAFDPSATAEVPPVDGEHLDHLACHKKRTSTENPLVNA